MRPIFVSLLGWLMFSSVCMLVFAPRPIPAQGVEGGTLQVGGAPPPLIMGLANLSNLRQVQGVVPDRQNYVVLDEDVWEHARHDLGDLRLFAGNTEVPYVLKLERGSESAQRSEAKLLNLGRDRVTGETGFVADMTGIPHCDELELRLADSAADFVAEAHVEGLNGPYDANGTDLGGSVLFDMSHEQLGSDFTIKFQPAAFPFLRVHLMNIAPEQVLRAIAIDSTSHNTIWTPVSASLSMESVGRTTVITWPASASVPVAQVVLDVDPSQVNFERDVEVLTPGGGTVTNSSVRRVHLVRDGKVADSESLAIELPYESWGAFRIVIENGDEPPLKITAAKGYFYERRIYFDPRDNVNLSLYTGNPRLAPPIYEYSKSFRADENAAVATFGLDMLNPEYRRRPMPRQR